MTEKQGRAVNIFTALLLLVLAAKAAPVLAAVAVLAGIGYLARKGRGALAVVGGSLALAVLAGYGTHLVQSMPHFALTGQETAPAVPPVVVRSWFGLAKLSNPANIGGRIGLIAGALIGLAAAVIQPRQRQLHGAGKVQGRPALEGGWADSKHLADLVEFGPPREGKYGGGIVLGKVDGRVVRVTIGRKGLACHTAIFGSTGSGKTFSVVYPNIISAVYDGASIVLSDPKGELLAGKINKQGQYEPGIAEFLRQNGYKILVLNLKNPSSGSNGWNPLLEAQDEAEFRQTCEAMIACAGRENPFFAGGEVNLFTALAGLTRYNAQFRDEWRHMRTVLSLLAWPMEALDEEFSREYQAGHLETYFYEKWNSSKTMLANFATGVANKVAVMTDGALAGVLAGHDIDLLQVAREKTALFCVLPTLGDLRPILTAFYFLLFKRLVNFAEVNHGSLPVPVRFILDEFANIGRVPDFEQRVSFDRGLGITYIVIMQALTQFSALYGGATADTILGQMDIRMSLRVNDLRTAGYFCNMFGDARVLETSERKD
ncbi:MAG: type IV secretory system conjugative DNA transfer family protein, partial [Candidatus Methanomethyliaceae archaeon]